MDNLLTVSLEAHNPDRNHHRRYEIRLGRDLFGEWTACLLYGRIGRGGQMVRHSSPDPERLRKVVQESLRRRLSAPKRIGCPYQLKALSAASEVDIGFWLPASALAEFVAPTVVSGGGESVPA